MAWSLRRVLDGRLRLPDVPGSRGCYRRGSSAPFPARQVGRRSARRGQRVRENESPGAAFGGRPHVGAGSLWREANGGRRLGRPVEGQLGQTGRLDLARPGSAAGGCPGIALRARVPPRLVRARRLQAASAERVAGGALARGGLRVPFGQWITACGAPRGRRLRALTTVRVGCALSAAPSLCTPGSRLVHKSGLGKVCHPFGREFHRRGPGTDPASSWARGGPPGFATGRRSPSRARPRRSLLRYGMARMDPSDSRFFPPLRGEGGRAQSLQRTGGVRRTLGVRRRAPCAGPLPPAALGLPYIRAGESLPSLRERISREAGGNRPLTSSASDTLKISWRRRSLDPPPRRPRGRRRAPDRRTGGWASGAGQPSGSARSLGRPRTRAAPGAGGTRPPDPPGAGFPPESNLRRPARRPGGGPPSRPRLGRLRLAETFPQSPPASLGDAASRSYGRRKRSETGRSTSCAARHGSLRAKPRSLAREGGSLYPTGRFGTPSLGSHHPERPSYISDGGCLPPRTQAVVSRQPEGRVSPLLLGRGGLPGNEPRLDAAFRSENRALLETRWRESAWPVLEENFTAGRGTSAPELLSHRHSEIFFRPCPRTSRPRGRSTRRVPPRTEGLPRQADPWGSLAV